MSILNKFFGAKSEKTENIHPTASPAPISSIHDMHKRSMVAWVAYRLGQLLEWEKEAADALLLWPFLQRHPEEKSAEDKLYLIRLASLLIDWIDEGHDVYLKVKETDLPGKHHECLLRVFNEVKEDLSFYSPARPKQEAASPSKEEGAWEIYRDVLFAATQKKLLLIPRDDIGQHRQGTLLCEADIKERADIPKARQLAKEKLASAGIPQTMVMSQLLVISEAITNILKHATEGTMAIYMETSNVVVLVNDTGPGIPLKLLPNTTLLAGYSTKKSLGQGFTLMMKMAEQILLYTSDQGTTLILKFNRNGGAEHAAD